MSLWKDFFSGATSTVDFLNRIAQLIASKGFWVRIGTTLAGALLMVLGIVILLRRQISGSVGEVAKVAAVV